VLNVGRKENNKSTVALSRRENIKGFKPLEQSKMNIMSYNIFLYWSKFQLKEYKSKCKVLHQNWLRTLHGNLKFVFLQMVVSQVWKTRNKSTYMHQRHLGMNVVFLEVKQLGQT